MKYGLHKAQYEEILSSLALVIYARSVDYGDGQVVFEHFAENGFEVPCSILTEAGIMQVAGTYPSNQKPHRHAFLKGWTTTSKLKIKQKPTLTKLVDVLVALCFLVDWDKAEFSDLDQNEKTGSTPPKLNVLDQWRFNSQEQHAFHRYAFHRAVEQLARTNLVRWRPTGGFDLLVSSNGDPPIDFSEAATLILAKYASA